MKAVAMLFAYRQKSAAHRYLGSKKRARRPKVGAANRRNGSHTRIISASRKSSRLRRQQREIFGASWHIGILCIGYAEFENHALSLRSGKSQ